MAASYTAERKSGAQVSGTSLSITPASNCTTGATLILALTFQGTATISSVSDTKGNTWSIDKVLNNGTTGLDVAICSSYQISGLTTSDTITVTFTLNSAKLYWLEEFAGNYSVADVSASSVNASSSTVTTGTTTTTTSADEFAVCVVLVGVVATVTKNASYTLFTTGQQTDALSETGSAWYRILSATGTQNGNGTSSVMTPSGALIATYKAFVAPEPKHHRYASNQVAIMRPALR